jgi:hypothetical protein
MRDKERDKEITVGRGRERIKSEHNGAAVPFPPRGSPLCTVVHLYIDINKEASEAFQKRIIAVHHPVFQHCEIH